MSGLAHIRDHLKPWDTAKHQDYKIRSVAFVCPKPAFQHWDTFKVQAWLAEDLVYGIASTTARTRLGKCCSVMRDAKLYRLTTKGELDLLKATCAADTSYKDSAEKHITIQCYREYVQSLYE